MNLFIYGTLRCKALRRAVAGSAGDVTGARVHGYGLHPVRDSVVPMVVATDGAVTEGLLWCNLTDAELDRLTVFEQAYDYRLVPVTVTQDDGVSVAASMWVPPDTLMPAAGEWSFAAWQDRCGAATVTAAIALFAQDPRPTADQVRWQYPMMLRRAWTRQRAMADQRPARLRHDASPSDVAVTDRATPLGRFFRLQGFDVHHRRFDGATQGPLPREVFVGVDAVLVMPYDPLRDRVVLVEQIRMGALERGDPNPWTLEPVAGMIDAFEDPADAALRETKEEAGLDVTLRHVASFYPSPGNATDYFHSYIGLCDIPQADTFHGGLAGEHEDLRLHVLDLDDALSLVASGEMTAGPGIALLYWLALHRDALRLEFASAGA